MGELAVEVSSDDQKALAMRWAALLDLPLQVDDLAAAEADARRDARGPAKRVVTEVVDGEAVDLAGDRSSHVDLDRAVVDELLDAVFDQIRAVDLLVDGDR